MEKRKRRPHWYKIYYGECPACGRDAGCRERVYGRKPRSEKKRYVFLSDRETYDGCVG